MEQVWRESEVSGAVRSFIDPLTDELSHVTNEHSLSQRSWFSFGYYFRRPSELTADRFPSKRSLQELRVRNIQEAVAAMSAEHAIDGFDEVLDIIQLP